MQTIIDRNDMTYVRAIVSDAEKEEVKRVGEELGLTESQLIRKGLEKMGVKIQVEKAVGVATGSVGNPSGKGGHENRKKVEEFREEIRADYQAGLNWKQLQEKYGFSTRTLGKVLEDLIVAKKTK